MCFNKALNFMILINYSLFYRKIIEDNEQNP